MRKASLSGARGIGVRFVTPKTATSPDLDLPQRPEDESADDDEPRRRAPPPPGMGKLVDKVV